MTRMSIGKVLPSCTSEHHSSAATRVRVRQRNSLSVLIGPNDRTEPFISADGRPVPRSLFVGGLLDGWRGPILDGWRCLLLLDRWRCLLLLDGGGLLDGWRCLLLLDAWRGLFFRARFLLLGSTYEQAWLCLLEAGLWSRRSSELLSAADSATAEEAFDCSRCSSTCSCSSLTTSTEST